MADSFMPSRTRDLGVTAGNLRIDELRGRWLNLVCPHRAARCRVYPALLHSALHLPLLAEAV
jgi:hypothetical protein